MSLADLSAKLYTVKSRRNVPISTAFVSMVREDLAMRYSVFNIVKSITRSEVLAQVAEARYGFKTPLQREEEAKNKQKADREKKFKQFTANSLVTLNNKINTLSGITQKNTILIENLYNDLGSFRHQKKFTKRDLNVNAVKMQLRSRTVKYQIDQIKAELTALEMITIGPKGSKKLKKAAESEAGIPSASSVGKAAPTTTPETPGTEPEKGSGGTTGKIIDTVQNTLIARQAMQWWTGRKAAPTATPAPTVPPAATNAKPPVWNEKLQRWQDPKSGRIVKAPPTPTTPSGAPATASKAAGVLGKTKSFVGGFLKGALVGELAVQAGPKNLDRLASAFQRKAAETRKSANEIAAKYGLKLIQGPNGATIGYEIDGVKYDKFEDLPIEYQNIINAYISPDRVAKQKALKVIAATPETYKLLETAEGRIQVLSPPVSDSAIDSTAAVLAAAAVAGTISEAAPSSDTTPKPKFFQRGAPKPEPTITPQTVTTLTTPTAVPSTTATSAITPATDVNTVKQIIVNAAERVGVEPGIMLAMGRQESSFNPNAQPWYTDKKTGERRLLSSAKGLFQFINKTWESMVAKYSNAFPELLNGPFDPMANALAGALYVKENSEILRKNKIPITGTSVYASHFLGPGGARVLFTSLPNSSAADVLPAPAKSNPFIFYDGVRPRTVSEVINVLYKKVGSKAEQYTAQLRTLPVQPLPSSTPGMPVSTPPTMVAAAASSSEMTSADVSGRAALAANKAVQDVVVGLGGKIADLEKQVNIDKEFPSVRYQA